MKLIIAILLFFPCISQAQKINYADPPDYKYLWHGDKIELDTIIHTEKEISDIKQWAAKNYNSLPDILKYEDSTTLIIKAWTENQVHFTQTYHIKGNLCHVSLTDIWGYMPKMTGNERMTAEQFYDLYINMPPKRRKQILRGWPMAYGVMQDIEHLYTFSISALN